MKTNYGLYRYRPPRDLQPSLHLTQDGELIERRIKTDKESFDKLFADHPRARILVEASTESEWCARYFESPGQEVIVADPNFAPMYATRDRRIKTDKRDARALCEAYRLGAYRPAHRTPDRQRDVRAHLLVRETLVRTRSKYISFIGALARGLPHQSRMSRQKVYSCKRFEIDYLPAVWGGNARRAQMSLLQRDATPDDQTKL